MQNTTISEGEKDPNLQTTISYSQLPSMYGGPSLHSIQNMSIIDIQNYSEPGPEENYHTFSCSNREIIHSDMQSETTDAFNQLLKSWNLEHLTEFLTSEKISIEVLKIIKRRHIAMLFQNQKIGDLVVFEQSLLEWRSSLSLFENEEEGEFIPEGRNQRLQPSPAYQLPKSNYSSPTSSRGIHSPDTTEFSISLFQILNENYKSKIVTNYYEQTSKLLEEHRSMLITIICNYFQENDYHMSLSTSYRLEEEIISRFPGERLEYYRVGKRGKLYTKACNTKSSMRSMIKRTLIPDTEDSSNIGIESTQSPKIKFSPEGDAEECIRAIKYDKLSAAEFESCWQACSQYRMKEMQDASSLYTIFTEWPQYKEPSGYRLIDKDFTVLHGNRAGILERWPVQAKKLKDFLLTENRIKDKKIREMLQTIEEADINSDISAVKLMWCLHAFLVPTQKAIKKDNTGKKSMVKFSITTSQQTFFFIGSSIQEIDSQIQFLINKGESIQPFILGLGDENFKNVTNFYVYLDGVKFVFKSFLRAIDICFKTFHVFNLEYPEACSQIWAFIQNNFYDMKNNKCTSPKMFVLMEALKN